MQINSAKDLKVYKAAYELAMRVFEVSKKFPAEERFALTSQIRRSSRSVCLNLREAWAKRRYEAYFISKLTDCDGETVKPSLRSTLPGTVDTSRRKSTMSLLLYARKSAACSEA